MPSILKLSSNFSDFCSGC